MELYPAVTWYTLVAQTTDTQLYGLGTFLVIATSLLLGTLPFLFLDYFKWPHFLYKYKIQPHKPVTTEFKLKALKLTLVNQLCIVLPGSLFFAPMLKNVGIEAELPLPTTWTMVIDMIVMLLLDDTAFYFGHRWLHTPWAYKRFHKVHHTFYAPFALCSNAVHPVELMIQSSGTILAAIVVSPHLLTLWVYFALRLWQGVDDHIGYDFPWDIGRLPFIGGTAYHDWHHSKNIGNFASCFTFFDYFLGTDTGYWEYREKVHTVKQS
eukprot:GFYU01005819.1.p1 GENE.GFYU01005819.1~~GFYU01005819.1.p1  ORF type:complete len:265 (-),score=38.09 GFYU01005819.1:115-909(-)